MAKKISAIIPKKLKSKIFNRFRQKIGYKLTLNRPDFFMSESVKSPYSYTIDTDNPLIKLGEEFKPTKRLHNYLPYYWRHFRDIRLQVNRVLEIGVQSDRSIKMWEAFFPNATIYGIDIDPACKLFEGGRRKIFIGSQDDNSFLQSVVDDAGGSFDVVIDDGSHFVNHQLKSFDYLFPRLTSHGIYVIEDTGPSVRDYDLKTVTSITNLLKHIYYPTQRGVSEHPGDMATFPETSSWADRNIRAISFYRWICFIERGNNPKDNPFLDQSYPLWH